MQKPLCAILHFLQKLAFLSGYYVYVQWFHIKVNEYVIVIAIKVKELNINTRA